MNTYECTICREINSAHRLHCKSCGSVPAMYSPKQKTIKSYQHQIPVISAPGCDRAESHRTIKGRLRTVPADYYATGE